MTELISKSSVMRIIDADPVYSDILNEKTYMAEQIDKLPVKESDRPHGEWIYKNGKYWCSSCGDKAIYHSYIQAPLPHLTNFCPNCGADMREGEANEI